MAEPSYTAVAEVLAALPLSLRAAREARGLSLRQAAEQIGVATSTVHRAEYGDGSTVAVAMAILCWLDQPPPVR